MPKFKLYSFLMPLFCLNFIQGCSDNNEKVVNNSLLLEAHRVKCAHYFQVLDKSKQSEAFRSFNKINANSGYVFRSVASEGYSFFLTTTLDCTKSFELVKSIYTISAPNTKSILRIIPREFAHLARSHTNIPDLEKVLIENKELEEIFPD